jgi:two-component system chemotaxis response regulator CheV
VHNSIITDFGGPGINVDSDSGEHFKALIADDSSMIREMMKDLLSKANFQVESCTNGKECWDRLQEIKAKA